MNWKKMEKRGRLAWRAFRHGETAFMREKSISPLEQETLQQIRHYFPMKKFFILGHARSGTTLLLRLVRLHPEIHANYQAHFFTRPPGLLSLVDSAEVFSWLTHRSNRWNGGKDPSAAMLRVAADFLMEREALALGKRIVGDKSPTSVWHGEAVQNMHAIYPDARLIYIVRDGRDVVLSERFRNLVEEKNLDAADRKIMNELAQDASPFVSGEKSIFTERFLRRIATRWAKDVLEVDKAGSTLYGERYFVLRYEDLLQEPMRWMTALWEFLDVEVPEDLAHAVQKEISENPDKSWQSQRNPALAGILPRGKSGNWRKFFTARDRALFAQLAGDALLTWRYEKSKDWWQ